ncbi:hypothetical protein GCM10007940_12280 [Portibacter lacus]|uniref:Sortilin N-terminal domain-containing protein n=2 Tax=Portibacter lacus TaxID=1099794 RepID=A0AA37SLB2_9BACT|nr:hypothetical protein GCM10007940_12280 [Portibacter lacus]
MLLGQKIDMEKLAGMSLRNIGPAGMSGRVTAIDVDLSNTDRIYIGTASGGVWLSENGGISWKPIFDEEETLSIGALKINQQNPSEIWVGTGEGNPRNSHNSGRGVYKSLDGGKTWKLMGLERTILIHRIIIHKDDPQTVYVGAMGSAWGPSEDRGVYKTTDGGETWTKSLYVGEEVGIGDMVVDPNNPNKIIAGMWEFGRKPWTFNSGGEGSGLYITVDGGNNWKEITSENGLPKGDLGRIGIAFATNKSNIVYALVEAKVNGLYKSTDGGFNWKLVSDKNIGGRPFYYAELYVDPQNENRIYNLHTYVTKSDDGGKTFRSIADYGNGVHPDHHAFWINPMDTEHVIDGNDGGLNISHDGGETWRFASNIPVGQFYHVNVDDDFPYHVYGGMQDNGSWVGPGYVLKSGGIRNNDWQELYFGDGFDVAAKPGDSRYGYAMSQGGNVGYYDRETGRTEFIKPVHPDGTYLRFNWNAALALDPFNTNGLYFGSQFVHYSGDEGKSWKIISPDLTTNDPEKQKQLESGGLTIDATQAENYTTIISIAPSPVDKNVVWVGTDDGNLQLTKDGGKTWANLSASIPGFPQGGWIPKLEVSGVNAGEVFVVVNDFRRNNWEPYLFHTSDYGVTWKRLVDKNDAASFVAAVIQDDVEPNLLFLGTDDGMYVSFDYGENWNKWNKKFPNVQIRDFAIQDREADLVIGTFGRAFWVLDDIRPLREIAGSNGSVLDNDFAVFEPGAGYQTNSRSYDGIRFTAQGEFIGDNKNTGGAQIAVWKKPAKKEEKEKVMDEVAEPKKKRKSKKKVKEAKEKAEIANADSDKSEKKGKRKKKNDSATMHVLSLQGDTLRTLTQKLEDGINYMTWRLDEKGVESPSLGQGGRRGGNREPGGNDVVPGTYKIVVEYNDDKDSTTIEVKTDPRAPVATTDLIAKNKMLKDYYKIITATKESIDQLVAAKKKVKLIGEMTSVLEDSLKSEIKDLNEATIDEIDSLLNIYTEVEEVKGIVRDPAKLSGIIGTPRRYLGSTWGIPGENAQNTVKVAKDNAQMLIDAINEFNQGSWKEYMERINEIKFEWFDETEEVRIKE